MGWYEFLIRKKFWKIIHLIFIFLIGIYLIYINTFFHNKLNVDYVTLAILILLTILPYLDNIKRITHKGTSIELEKSIDKVAEEVGSDINEEQVTQAKTANEQFNQFAQYIYNIESIDPNLAMVKLRTELELTIKNLYLKINPEGKQKNSIGLMACYLTDKQIIDLSIKESTNEVCRIASKIFHGALINPDVSQGLIDTFLKLIAFYYNKLLQYK